MGFVTPFTRHSRKVSTRCSVLCFLTPTSKVEVGAVLSPHLQNLRHDLLDIAAEQSNST